MQIRPYSDKDLEAVVQLWRDCGLTRPWNDPYKDIERKLAVQPELFLVGELNGKLIATAMAGYDGHRGSVFYLAVAEKYQRCAYGQKLMTEVERVLMAMGCPKLNIVVRASNNGALKFYEKYDYLIDDVVSVGKRLIPDE